MSKIPSESKVTCPVCGARICTAKVGSSIETKCNTCNTWLQIEVIVGNVLQIKAFEKQPA